MPDFPLRQASPLHLTAIASRYGIGSELRIAMGGGTPGALTWTANQAVYMPVSIPWPYLVARVFWVNGSTITSTSADFGIYTASGAKIYSTGSTAMAGASSIQYVTPGTPFILDAGSYFFAWACNNTTNRAHGLAIATPATAALCGCLSQTSAFALPATATFATFGAPGVVVCGITRTASGF